MTFILRAIYRYRQIIRIFGSNYLAMSFYIIGTDKVFDISSSCADLKRLVFVNVNFRK